VGALRVDWNREGVFDDCAACEVIVEPSGTTTLGAQIALASPSSRIATMVAANSGRPGGACGGIDCVQDIHAGHSTQEEDLVSNWMLVSAGSDRRLQDHIYRTTIYRAWGMANPEQADTATIQAVDYTGADTDPSRAVLYADAWVVPGCRLGAKARGERGGWQYNASQCYETALVFCSGPNASRSSLGREGSSSMRRTYSAAAAKSYDFFYQGVKWAMRAGLDAMVSEGYDVALLASLSCGLYAGTHRGRIEKEIEQLINELLEERVGPLQLPRGRFFSRVILCVLR